MTKPLPLSRFLMIGAVALAPGFAFGETAAPTPPKHIPLQKTIGEVTPTGPVPSLFVLNSDGATLADGKLTMTGVSANSIVFADRPVRSAGHVMTAQFIQQWDEDKGNFIIDPPNGTISVLGGVGSDISDAVVELTKPVLDGTTLTFEVRVLEGALTSSGPAALFIDRGGFGRGGFHAGGASFTGPRGGTADFAHAGGYHGAGWGGGYHGGDYWHAPDYHGAWYGAGGVVAGAAVGAAVGAAAVGSYYNNRGPDYGYPPYCGYYPYPPCY